MSQGTVSAAPPISWGAVQAALARRFGTRIAVADAAGEITYADLLAHAAGIARHLLALGVRPGAPVGTFFRNGRAAVAAAYGVQIAGAAEVPLNSAYGPAELEAVTQLAGCRHVLCAAADTGRFASAHAVEAIAPAPLVPADFPAVAPDLPGRFAFTSGTTGLPKAILYTQRARFLANMLLQACLPWLPGPGSRVLLMTPFAHGASLQAFAWLDQGGTVVLHDGADPARVLPLLEAQALEAVFAPPTVLSKLVGAFAGRRFAGVRTIFTGTAPLAPELYARARAMFGPVVRLTYGKSEVINPITVLPPAETERFYAEGGTTACVGWPAPGVELAIEDGEVLIRAQHMSAGWIDAAGFHPWRADGFHPTGDIGEIDAEGRLHLLARVSDAMKSGGYKIYPQEIEPALALPACETAVVGLPSAHWGEVVTAVAARPPPGWEAQARAACAQLTPYKRPRLHVALDEFPRNAQGKLVRRLLVAAILQRWRLVDGPRPHLEPI